MYQCTCVKCNTLFQSRFKDVKICEECKNSPCEVCGKLFKREWPYNQRACSPECRHVIRSDPRYYADKEAKRKATVMTKYGVDNVSKIDEVRSKIKDKRNSAEFKEKVRNTCLEKYGVNHYSQSDEYKKKFEATMIERYGVRSAMLSPEFRKIISDTMKSDETLSKRLATIKDRYGVDKISDIPGVKEKAQATSIAHYGVPYYVMTDEYRKNAATNQISKPNIELANRLNAAGLATEFEFKIDSKVYDIRLKEYDVVIEVDPSYTHSDLPNHWNVDGLPKNYHLVKSTIATDANFRCIHVFDWDNIDRIVNMLKPKRKIYGRNCEVRQIDSTTANDFCANYHIQGPVKHNKVCLGLFWQDELVEIMTFGHPRYNKNYQWELLRLCTKDQITVVGGASKLFKSFINSIHPNSIISYCDRAKFDGSVYNAIGMTLHHTAEPSKVWSWKSEKITDNLLRQRGFDQLFGTDFGKGTSNEELMILHGWRSVYDCGQLVYTWECKE